MTVAETEKVMMKIGGLQRVPGGGQRRIQLRQGHLPDDTSFQIHFAYVALEVDQVISIIEFADGKCVGSCRQRWVVVIPEHGTVGIEYNRGHGRTRTRDQIDPAAFRQAIRSYCYGREGDGWERASHERVVGVEHGAASTEVETSAHVVGRTGVHTRHR